MSTVEPKLLSIIIPVYKQEKTIRRNLSAILAELDLFRLPYEVIVVIDGYGDKSREEAEKIKHAKISIIGYEKNQGKGYAVRYGMVRAKGDVIGFIDAGGEIRESGIQMLIEHMRWYNADIIVGSKRHPASKVQYPVNRRIFSFGYQMLVRLLFGLTIRDTQTGLKLYKRHVLEDVLPRVNNDHFSFDIEMLAVAHHLGYTRIYESPIEIDFNGITSTIYKNPYPVIFEMLKDTLYIYYRMYILHYYDNLNGHLWNNNPELLFNKKTKQ
jgi:glycosyltransferase involved in cell wall biosynthesis